MDFYSEKLKGNLMQSSMGQGHRIKMTRNDTSNREEGGNNQIASCYFSSDKQIGSGKLQHRQ